MTQPELPLNLPFTASERRREGERGSRERKEVDPDAVLWRRVHTSEKCHACIAEQTERFLNSGSARAAWPASYIRLVVGSSREALCFEHAAPRRQAEGLHPQRSSDPNNPKNRKPPAPRTDTYE